jgi:hypothetical protein
MRHLYILASCALLSGCITLSPDGQMGAQSEFSKAQFNQEAFKVSTQAQFASRNAAVENALKGQLTLNHLHCAFK